MGKTLPKLILLSIMVLALVPFGSTEWQLGNLGDLNVDIAFQLAQPYFIEQRLQFGEQVIFTYGPWGILLTAFAGSTYQVAVLLFRFALAVCISLALCALIDRLSDRKGRIVAWIGAATLVLLWVTGHRDSYFLFPALMVAYLRLSASLIDESAVAPVRNTERLLWIALSLLAGWASLAKFNILVVSTIAYLLILADDVKGKRWPALPLAYTTALLFAWLGAGQNLANLPLWILRCLDLSNGYADAMAKGFFNPYSAQVVAAYYGAVALVMLAAFAAAAKHRWKYSAVLLLLFTLFVCAISVKHGMGGNQVEQSIAVLVAALWFVVQLLVVPTVGSDKHDSCQWGRFGLTTAVTVMLSIAVVAANTNFPIISAQNALADIRANARQMANALHGISADKWGASLEGLHRFWVPSIAPTGQTIDVYPHQTGLVIGREGLNYVPRPAFLSLNAHTSALALLNARHLEKSTAADLILFQVLPKERSVNNRHPALADGPSWPLLLSRYAPENISDEFLLLKKRLQPLHVNRKLLLQANLRLGETVHLPQSDRNLLWAELEMKRSFAGDIIHALYKSPHVVLESRTAASAVHVAQIVPELGKAGFLLSPLVQSNAAFAELYEGPHVSGQLVQSITILSPEAPDFFWYKTFALKLYSLDIGSMPQKK